jgi:hypothetical protein
MRYALLSFVLVTLSSVSCAADWLTLPSTYSHDATCTRVTQFAPIEVPTAPLAANFRTSGFTHTRSSLNYGASSDNYHRVQKWGEPVRPYGEWRFPYRPHSTPYPNWGAPFAGFNSGFGGPGFGYGGVGGGYGGGHGKPTPQEGDETYDEDDKDHHAGPGYRGTERGFLGDGRWPSDRNRNQNFPTPQATPFNPYPAGPGTPYPVAPYYDGYYPNYRK